MDSIIRRTLRTLGAGLVIVLLAACAGQFRDCREPGQAWATAQPEVPVVAPGASGPALAPFKVEPRHSYGRAGSGETVARHLQERFDETFSACTRFEGDPDPKPAILCSGVIMRATLRGPGFHIWNPNPNSPVRNGVAFSWLRKDSGFSQLVFGYHNGFILLPHFYADDPDDHYTQLTVLCAFPFDAASWGRQSGNFDGCGAYTGIADSGPCQAQNIHTSQQWLARFANRGMYGNQCGFTITPGTASAYLAFLAQTQIRGSIPTWFSTHNEVLIGTWGQNDRNLPLEAFFYINGWVEGRNQAMANQVDFDAATGRWAPVIQITLPPTPHGAAIFRYLKEDQPIQ